MKLSAVYSASEPMVNKELGRFSAIRIPVQKTNSSANWSVGSNAEYIVPETQEEYNRLLNTYYPQRDSMPDWKERGEEEERKFPHFNPKDAYPKKPLNARSSVIQDIAFDPERELAWLKMGKSGKWYAYSASPEQFKRFMMSGSLGKEMNNIKHDRGMSMMKTQARTDPKFVTGYQAGPRYGLVDTISSALSRGATSLSNIYSRLIGR